LKVKYEQKAIGFSTDDGLKKGWTERLALYRDKKPYRDEPKP
jgi:hypothetical protein